MAYIGKTPASAALTSSDISDGIIITDKLAANAVVTSKITDGTIATVDVADNAINLAKMASGTDGNIISYDASGNPVAVATGNDGQVLTSAGAGAPPAFEAAPAGGLTKIQTISANNTATVDFDNLPNTFSTYVIYGAKIKPVNNNADFTMNFGTDGSTYAANKTSLYWMQYNNEGDSDPQAEKNATHSLGNSTAEQQLKEN